MKLETRSTQLTETKWDNHIILLAENETESRSISQILRDCGNAPIPLNGEVTFSDSYDGHYIRLRWTGTQPSEGRAKSEGGCD